MKKIILLFLTVCMLFVSGCGGSSGGGGSKKPDTVSQKAYDAGKAVLSIADAYLDFKIEAEDAEKQIDVIFKTLERENPDFKDDYNVYLNVSSLLIDYRIDGSRVRVLEVRNVLAKRLELKERE